MGNRAADNGIIESITCINFMCHAYLEIPLGPLINFVVGRNGSGKSAILTALAICLGGKASSTNRGQSLKSFIMTGQEFVQPLTESGFILLILDSIATLSVKIKNKGESSYQHELYGDHILVERQFTRAGTSGFKLKSCTGRTISTKKAALDDICDYFAMQIDNPMNVLTQDMARQFLNSSNPYDKYKFFMKGTQLESLDADYLQIEQSLQTIETGSEIRERDLRDLEEETRKARQMLHLSQKQDGMREKISQLGRQMAWAQVEEQERELISLQSKVDQCTDDVQKAEREEAEAIERSEQAQQLLERATSGVQELQEDLQPLSREEDEKSKVHDERKASAMDIKSQQRQIQAKIKEARQTKQKTEKDIQDEHRRLEDLNGGSHARRLEEIEGKRLEAADAKHTLHDHDSQIRGLEQAKLQAEETLQHSMEPIDLKRREVYHCEQELQNMMRDRGQRQSAYHQNLPRLLRAIQEESGFQNKPIGPMGHHVQLLKPIWSSVLEKYFGGVLEGFVVTSKADQTKLSALARRVSCPCQVFIAHPNAISRLNEPDPGLETVFRVIEIDNDLVRDQLIIGQSIEQTILVEDLGEAHRMMGDERLANVKQCLSIQKTHKGAGARTAYGYGNTLTETYIPPWQGLPRMKTDIEFQINHKKGLLNDLKAELNGLESAKREKQQALTQAQQAIVRHQRHTRDLRLAAQRAQETVEGLQDALERDAVEEGRLDELKRILEEATEEVKMYEDQYQDSVNELDKAKEEMNDAQKELQEVKSRVEEANARIGKAERKVAKYESERQAFATQRARSIDIVTRAERRQREAEQTRAEKAKTVEEFIGEASKVSARREPVPEGETGDSLDKKLGKLNEDLERAEQRAGGSRSELASTAKRRLAEYQHAEKQFKELKALTQLLKVSLVTRRETWHKFKKRIVSRAKIQFGYLLSERGFKGRLLVDHPGHKLDIVVEPDGEAARANADSGHNNGEDKKKKKEDKTTQGLSGGEKSFSTTCLLLSLWDAMGAPIRCLDEFDVFMDSVNRTVSMKMMIGAARSSVGRQFIFITPGSMDAVPEAADVKVTKMRDPERGLQPIRLTGNGNNAAGMIGVGPQMGGSVEAM